jgi:hypothetical protein
MKTLILSVLLLLCSFPAFGQKLPPNFEMKRETGQVTGVPVFTLVPSNDAMAFDIERGSTFEALGALVQPERDKFGLLFYNVKKEYQLGQQKRKSVTLRIDGEEFIYDEYLVSEHQPLGSLKMEIAGVQINRTVFERLVKANDVFIRVDDARYSLDQDNIDALRYFGAEIEKDIARRSKRNNNR